MPLTGDLDPKQRGYKASLVTLALKLSRGDRKDGDLKSPLSRAGPGTD